MPDSEPTTEPEKQPHPLMPRPEAVAAQILDELLKIETCKTDIILLRRLLKFSCEHYGVAYSDPSARKKVAT